MEGLRQGTVPTRPLGGGQPGLGYRGRRAGDRPSQSAADRARLSVRARLDHDRGEQGDPRRRGPLGGGQEVHGASCLFT